MADQDADRDLVSRDLSTDQRQTSGPRQTLASFFGGRDSALE